MFLNLETHETKVCHLDRSTILAMVNDSGNLYNYFDNSFPIFDNTEFKTLMSDKNTWFPIGICVIPREFTENNKSRWVFLYNINMISAYILKMACRYSNDDIYNAYYICRDSNNDRYTDIFQPQDTMGILYFYDTMTFFTNDKGDICQL